MFDLSAHPHRPEMIWVDLLGRRNLLHQKVGALFKQGAPDSARAEAEVGWNQLRSDEFHRLLEKCCARAIGTQFTGAKADRLHRNACNCFAAEMTAHLLRFTESDSREQLSLWLSHLLEGQALSSSLVPLPGSSESVSARVDLLFAAFAKLPRSFRTRLQILRCLPGIDRAPTPTRTLQIPIAAVETKTPPVGWIYDLHLELFSGQRPELIESPEMWNWLFDDVWLTTIFKAAERSDWQALDGPVVWRISPREVGNTELPHQLLFAGASHAAAVRSGFEALATGEDHERACLLAAEVGPGDHLKKVGGVLEKCQAAQRSGIQRVVVALDAEIDQGWIDGFRQARPPLHVLRRKTFAQARAEATGLASGLRAYLNTVVRMANEDLPGYFSHRKLTDVYVEPDVLPEPAQGSRVKWNEMLPCVRRALIWANPGGGKTLLMRCSAAALARQGLAELDKSDRPAAGVTVPIRLRLSDVASRRSLADAIGDSLPELPVAVVRHLCDSLWQSHCWLFLDGLNEVPDEQQKDLAQALAFLRNRQEDGSFDDSPCHVILTSRPEREELRLPFDNLAAYQLASLDSLGQQFLIANWFKTLPDSAHLLAVTDLVKNNEAMRQMAGNPLLLTLACVAVTDLERSPAKELRPALLYESIVRRLYREAREDVPRPNELLLSIKVERLQDVAWRLFQNAEGRSTFDDVRELIPAIRAANEPERRSAFDVVKELLAAGLIHPTGSGETGFLHPSLLHYLAAAHVASRPDPAGEIDRWVSDRRNRAGSPGVVKDGLELIRFLLDLPTAQPHRQRLAGLLDKLDLS